jgi:hypothetical protein
VGLGRSLIPGVVVNVVSAIPTGSMVLSAVGVFPPHDGGDWRGWINV